MLFTMQTNYEAVPQSTLKHSLDRENHHKRSWTNLGRSIIIRSIFIFLLLICSTILGYWAIHRSRSHTDKSFFLPATDLLVAHVKNGSYRGLRLDRYDQDVWLGIPYASPPVKSLRFSHPEPFNETWSSWRNATEYGPHCPGYGHHEGHFPHSEDCLTINVIRPRATHQLPVGVFIYGGQNHGGGSSDPRYNLSFIVQTASDAGLPFIAVSFNYRASMWGFLPGRQSLGTGNTNLGLRDQRLALRWVQENISSFGGDNTKVTIWGGSSGADDVGFHLIAHGGRDDRLFRAAIMQSGTPVAKMANAVEGLQDMYQDLVTHAGCSASDDVLKCLRTVPYEQLNTAFVDSEKGNSPRMLAFALKALDGNFIPTYGSLALLRQAIAKVPIITGLMTNEGSSSIPLDVRTWADEREHLIDDLSFPAPVADHLMSLYPLAEKQANDVLDPPLKSLVSRVEFERIEALEGDIYMNAANRLQCETYTDVGAGCYSFRFNAAIPSDHDPRLGVMHASEIGPLLQNLDGLGLPINPFSDFNDNENFRRMARLMGVMWAGFIVHLDPNAGMKGENNAVDVYWPKFSRERRERMVFNSTGPWLEQDFNRIEAMKYISRIQHSVMDL